MLIFTDKVLDGAKVTPCSIQTVGLFLAVHQERCCVADVQSRARLNVVLNGAFKKAPWFWNSRDVSPEKGDNVVLFKATGPEFCPVVEFFHVWR